MELSGTGLPGRTTCPQRLFVSILRKTYTHPSQVVARNTVSECSRRNSRVGELYFPRGCLLSADPFSYTCLVMITVTSTPDQSAMALPKNEPRWVRTGVSHDQRDHNGRCTQAQGVLAKIRFCCGLQLRIGGGTRRHANTVLGAAISMPDVARVLGGTPLQRCIQGLPKWPGFSR